MEILTAFTKSELEQIVSDVVQKCLEGKLSPPKQVLQDRISINEACELTGYLKPTIYKKSFTGEIPCSRHGKFLVFSRKELAAWIEHRTTRKQSNEEISTRHLQKEAQKKLR